MQSCEKLTRNRSLLIDYFSQSHEILCGAADEVLEVLKNDRYKDREKKIQTEELLGPLTEERFALYVNLAKKITDFGNEGKTQIAGNIIFFNILDAVTPYSF